MKINNNSKIQDNINKYFPLLLEVRKRILFVISIFVLFGILGFFYYEKIVTFTINLLDLNGVNIVFTSPFQFLNLAISSSLSIGLIATIPVFIYQLLNFLKPALKLKEYRSVMTLLPISLILFVTGFAFGFLMMKYVVTIFYTKSIELNIGNMLDISKLLSQILITSTFMGLAFQFPIIMSILMDLKIVSNKSFSKQRPFAYVIAICFAAFMPPTDILSLFLLTFPLILLFELTLFLNKIFRKEVI